MNTQYILQNVQTIIDELKIHYYETWGDFLSMSRCQKDIFMLNSEVDLLYFPEGTGFNLSKKSVDYGLTKGILESRLAVVKCFLKASGINLPLEKLDKKTKAILNNAVNDSIYSFLVGRKE